MSIKRFFREELIKRVIATKIRLTILSGLATIEPPIGPTVSQFGIGASDFCNRFNILSSLYLPGSVYLTVIVLKSGYDFSLVFKGAKSSNLLKSISFLTKSEIKFYIFLTDILKIAMFKYFEISNSFKYKSLFLFTNSLFGTITTMNCTILLD